MTRYAIALALAAVIAASVSARGRAIDADLHQARERMHRATAELRGVRLPKAALPNSDAGVLQRISSSCTPNKRLVSVEARGIAFTATKYGAEALRFFGAPSASR